MLPKVEWQIWLMGKSTQKVYCRICFTKMKSLTGLNIGMLITHWPDGRQVVQVTPARWCRPGVFVNRCATFLVMLLDCYFSKEMRSLSCAETESCRGNRRSAVPDKSRDDSRPSNINFGWRTSISSRRRPVSCHLLGNQTAAGAASSLGWKEFSVERDFRQAVFAVLGSAGLSSPVAQASVSQVSVGQCNTGIHRTLWMHRKWVQTTLLWIPK